MARLRSVLRSLRIWSVVVVLLSRLWWDGRQWTYLSGASEEAIERRQRRLARWLLHELLGLGSAFIKLGQLLSARPDLLPAPWVEQLAQLQDRVPSFPFPQAEALLEAELGPRRSEIMRIEPRPLGSASLAQVHRATLHSGRDVVLKLQRPGLEKLFRLDLQVMEQVAAVLQRHPNWGRGRDWVAMARECRRVLLRELDFRLEAEHAARFRQ